MDVSALKRLKELEEENRRLKQMYAELSLEHKAVQSGEAVGALNVAGSGS